MMLNVLVKAWLTVLFFLLLTSKSFSIISVNAKTALRKIICLEIFFLKKMPIYRPSCINDKNNDIYNCF